MNHLMDALSTCPIVPVVAGIPADRVLDLAHALEGGGITTIELTLRDADAMDALRTLCASDTKLVVGVGTVRTVDQLSAAIDAGARFAVSPGLTESLARASATCGVPLLPGVATASEVMRALDAGLSTLKLFPAEALGGVKMLKALAGPFPEVRWMPTGGIREDTAGAWLRLPNVVAVGGSWLAPRDGIARRDWSAMRAMAERSAAIGRR